MMNGVPLDTCWAFNKLWNNKLYYKLQLVGISTELYIYIYIYKSCLLYLVMISEYSSPNKKTESVTVLSKCKECPYHSVFLLSLSWIPQLEWDVPADVGFLNEKAVALSSPVKVRSCTCFVHLTRVCHTEFSVDTCAASATVTRVIVFLLGTDLADSGRFAMASVD